MNTKTINYIIQTCLKPGKDEKWIPPVGITRGKTGTLKGFEPPSFGEVLFKHQPSE